ncbi:hypothetical protein GB937_002283 [Aspergillus fischeri]|nr:hypothetical protein GB937_002283 [Aspergillus fischeri]
MLKYAPRSGTYLRKLTLHTTTGCFELPNYTNGQVPGLLIEESPFGRSPRNVTPRDLDTDTAATTLDATSNVINAGNMVPFYTSPWHCLARAHSLICNTRISYSGCIDIIPLIPLLDDPTGPLSRPLHAIVAGYFFFSGDSTNGPTAEREQNAFASAAFLANDMFMTSNYHEQSIGISCDRCTSPAHLPCRNYLHLGIIIVWIPRWTGTLDSVAMLRIRASMAERFLCSPLEVSTASKFLTRFLGGWGTHPMAR